MAMTHAHHHDDHHDHKPSGFVSTLAVHHQPQGHRHAVPAVSLTMLFIGGSLAMVIRAELFQPGLQIVDPEFFNQMTTMHALVMIFGA
jgi:cytochrome c oxidase subunit 1